jgi:hypothetical protein
MIKSTLNEGMEDFEFVVKYFELPIFKYIKNIKHPLTLLKEMWKENQSSRMPDDMETHIRDEIEYLSPKLNR